MVLLAYTGNDVVREVLVGFSDFSVECEVVADVAEPTSDSWGETKNDSSTWAEHVFVVTTRSGGGEEASSGFEGHLEERRRGRGDTVSGHSSDLSSMAHVIGNESQVSWVDSDTIGLEHSGNLATKCFARGFNTIRFVDGLYVISRDGIDVYELTQSMDVCEVDTSSLNAKQGVLLIGLQNGSFHNSRDLTDHELLGHSLNHANKQQLSLICRDRQAEAELMLILVEVVRRQVGTLSCQECHCLL